MTTDSLSLKGSPDLGQHFTPQPVARAMVAWATRDFATESFLDPGIGPGVFLHALLDGRRQLEVTAPLRVKGIDIDPIVLMQAYHGATPSGQERLVFLQTDFLRFKATETFDSVVCNPPYLRHHSMPNKAANIAALRDDYGIALPISTNAYCLFMLRARAMLSANGRAAFIVPSEFLNSDYGVVVKKYLQQDSKFLGAILFDFKTLIFKALTTSCILLFDNRQHRESVSFLHIDSIEHLAEAINAISNGVSKGEQEVSRNLLDPARKWHTYGKHQDESSARFVPLRTFARCSRGIATGANNFFALRPSDVSRLQIPQSDVLPCLTKSTQALGPVFTASQFEELRGADAKIYLLSPNQPLNPGTEAYLRDGMTHNIHIRHLPSKRPLWYSPERRLAPDILVVVFSRGKTRFVRNLAGVRNLTTFHGIYVRPEHEHLLPLMMIYFWSSQCQLVMRDEQRQYGGGLQKYEPRDVENIKVPNFLNWPAAYIHKAVSLYESVASNSNITDSRQRAIDDLLAACGFGPTTTQ